MDPGFRLIPRRSGLRPPELHDVDQMMAEREASHSAGFTTIHRRLEAVRGDRLSLALVREESADGFTREFHAVEQMAPDGLLNGVIAFDPEELPDALEELDRLYLESRESAEAGRAEGAAGLHGADATEGSVSLPGAPRNRCTDVAERFAAMFGAKDWAGIRDLHADEVVVEDHRSGPTSGSHTSRDQIVESAQSLVELGYETFDRHGLAVRGERVCLDRSKWITSDGFVTDRLAIIELDEEDRISFFASFDEDDMTGALESLDQRYLAGEGAQCRQALEPIIAYQRAAHLRAPDQLAEVLADDLVVRDHTVLGWPDMDRDAYLDRIRDFMGMVRRFGWYPEEYLGLTETTSVFTFSLSAERHDGGVIAERGVGVGQQRDGLSTLIETWEISDLDAAMARFHQLTAGEPDDASAETGVGLRSRVPGVIAELRECLRTGSVERLRELVAQDVSRIDHREGPDRPRPSKGSTTRSLPFAAWRSSGLEEFDFRCVATRGESMALLDITHSHRRLGLRRPTIAGDPAQPRRPGQPYRHVRAGSHGGGLRRDGPVVRRVPAARARADIRLDLQVDRVSDGSGFRRCRLGHR